MIPAQHYLRSAVAVGDDDQRHARRAAGDAADSVTELKRLPFRRTGRIAVVALGAFEGLGVSLDEVPEDCLSRVEIRQRRVGVSHAVVERGPPGSSVPGRGQGFL